MKYYFPQSPYFTHRDRSSLLEMLSPVIAAQLVLIYLSLDLHVIYFERSFLTTIFTQTNLDTSVLTLHSSCS